MGDFGKRKVFLMLGEVDSISRTTFSLLRKIFASIWGLQLLQGITKKDEKYFDISIQSKKYPNLKELLRGNPCSQNLLKTLIKLTNGWQSKHWK